MLSTIPSFRCRTGLVQMFRCLIASAWLLAGGASATAVGDDKPVILLTGFEPFGNNRPPNPSWEGICDLNETDWNGYRIVAHQLPVIWGEPLKHFREQIEKHHPVAIFSFGQGGEGTFALESRAGKTRGRIPDNDGQLPTEYSITDDGPAEFQASMDCQQMKELLSKQGYPVRISRQAGQYLCEETLYSLEYTKKTKPELVVAFCHVPPLGTRVGTMIADKAYVQKFIIDYLTAWHSISAIRKAVTPDATPVSFIPAVKASEPVQDEKKANPETAAVEKLISGYFKSWSEQRMKDYGNCFAEGSVIQEISQAGEIYTQAKIPFVSAQTSYHKAAVHKAIEVPVRTDITFEAELARAVVYWKLTAGPRVQFGYDHFTLIQQEGEWKIVNLVFYGTKDRE